LRIAVVGCGVRGIGNARCIQRTARTSLALVMDSIETSAKSLGDELGVPWTTDYESVLSASDVDVVFINSPHHLHAEHAVAAASAGKHVIVEKPLAHNLEAAREIVRTAREAGVVLSPWLGFRYLPKIIKAKELIDQGALGNILGAQVTNHMHKPPHYFAGGAANWKTRWESAGGGVLINQTIHILDWLLYLAGREVVEVSSSFGSLDTDIEVEDTLAMWLRFDNGATATLNASTCVQGLYRQDQVLTEFRLWGTEGHLSLTPPAQFFTTRHIGSYRPDRWQNLAPLPQTQDAEIEFLERFAEAVLEGNEPQISGEDGLRVQAVIEAAYASGRTGRSVTVDHRQA
jgi:predicted dehydrogenase